MGLCELAGILLGYKQHKRPVAEIVACFEVVEGRKCVKLSREGNA